MPTADISSLQTPVVFLSGELVYKLVVVSCEGFQVVGVG